jgi:hypothetical protein
VEICSIQQIFRPLLHSIEQNARCLCSQPKQGTEAHHSPWLPWQWSWTVSASRSLTFMRRRWTMLGRDRGGRSDRIGCFTSQVKSVDLDQVFLPYTWLVCGDMTDWQVSRIIPLMYWEVTMYCAIPYSPQDSFTRKLHIDRSKKCSRTVCHIHVFDCLPLQEVTSRHSRSSIVVTT